MAENGNEWSGKASDGRIQVRGWNLDARERLKTVVRDAGGPKAVSDRAGIPLTTLHAALRGDSDPRSSMLAAIAEVSGRSLDWIMFGDRSAGQEQQQTSMPPADLLRVPFFDVRASAGPGSTPLEEKPTEVIEIERRFALMLGVTASDIIALPIQGDSAQPGLSEGDMIIVDRSLQELRDGGLYVIGVDSDIIVKRVHRQADRSVVLRSDNPAYEPQHIGATDVEHLRVIGRVRWAIRGM